jgi:hypothetical protein
MEKDIRDAVTLSYHLIDNNKDLIIKENSSDSIIAKLTFYENDLTVDEKKDIGNVLLCEIADIVFKSEKKITKRKKAWEIRSKAFKEALQYENLKNKPSITNLIVNILNLTPEEAVLRYDLFISLKELNISEDFHSTIVEKILLNDSHLEEVN